MGPHGARTRTYQWDDPTVIADAARRMSGLEIVRSLLSGDLPAPPITHTLGFRITEAEPGRVVFSAEAAEYMYNPIGSVHGGVYATLLDSAAGCAVHTLLPVGARYTSLDLSVKFLKAMTTETGVVRCIGTVTHLGRRTALAEARMTDGKDRLLATATSSCLVTPAPGPE
ncbi:PaaI family thioesterase [Streptomyces sp. NPDC048639]|uniref:PaaI family thioesterase n=1 Tax=Streptomyces sp. NPDC048639 TaxID=3365581 RepID=UPI003716147E